MSNLIGKVLIGASKLSEGASTCFGNAATAANNFADSTKKKAKVAMLRAEIDTLKTRLADNVVSYGLSADNENAACILNEINEKLAQIEKLEPTVIATDENLKKSCNHDNCTCEDTECSCEDGCDENCECECHEVEADTYNCNECDDLECNCECHESDEDDVANK